MNRNAVKATLASDSGKKPKVSWTVSPEEVISLERENRALKPQVFYYQSTASPVNKELISIPVVSQPRSSTPQVTKLTPTSLQAEHSLSPTRGVNVGDITKPASPPPLYLDTDVESENEVFFPQHVLQNLCTRDRWYI